MLWNWIVIWFETVPLLSLVLAMNVSAAPIVELVVLAVAPFEFPRVSDVLTCVCLRPCNVAVTIVGSVGYRADRTA